VGHLYGVALYYATCALDFDARGISHSRPEFQYYWVYYAGFNAPWVIVPACECSCSASRLSYAWYIQCDEKSLLTNAAVLLAQSIRRIVAKERALRDINGFIRKSKLEIFDGTEEAKKTR
jgi:hypothetical protein